MFQNSNSLARKRGYNAENAAVVFARLIQKDPVDLKDHPIVSRTLEPGTVLEISGPIGTGKSSLLIDIATRCLLPETEGGLGMGVVYIDCDRQFHIDRLITSIGQVMTRNSYYYDAARRLDVDANERIIKSCLERFRYTACDCSDDLLNIFDLLDDTLCVELGSNSGPSKGWLIMIDVINAFYWLDRTSRSYTNVGQIQRRCAQRLQQFLAEHNTTAIITKLIITTTDMNKDKSNPDVKGDSSRTSPKFYATSTLDASWTALITSTISLATETVRDCVRRKAIRENGATVCFAVDFNGISYV